MNIFKLHTGVALSLCILPLIYAQNDTGPWTTWNNTGLNDYEAIQQTINLDAIATDTKTWSLLAQVYTINATASYSATGSPSIGLAAIQATLEKGVGGFTTQHLQGSMLISIGQDGMTANATYYAQATLFTDPQQTPGQVAFLYGYYNDKLVKTSDGWRIDNLVYRFMGPGMAGNTSILG